MAEQRTLHQSLGKSGAVDGDEGLVGARTLVVDRPGEQLLAGARLALDQHGRAGDGDSAHDLHRPAKRLAVAHQSAPSPDLDDLAAKGLVFPPQPDHLQRLADRHIERLRLDRLGEVVDRSRFDGDHGVLDTRVAGHDDDRNLVAFAVQLGEEVEPGEAGHAVVGDDEVDGRPGDHAHRIFDARHQDRAVARSAECVLQDDTDGRLVVDAQN